MITIFAKATDPNNLRDLLRSLINNAQKRENYRIFVGGDTERDSEWLDAMEEFKDRSDIFLMKEGDDPKPIDAQIIWILSDEVLVLGYHWDKRILFYRDKYPDDIIVMFPSGTQPYGVKTETEVAQAAERYPLMSAQWVSLVGMQDAEMICRALSIKHGIDRRINIRPLGVMQRGSPSAQPVYALKEIERKAAIISEYINSFTPSVT